MTSDVTVNAQRPDFDAARAAPRRNTMSRKCLGAALAATFLICQAHASTLFVATGSSYNGDPTKAIEEAYGLAFKAFGDKRARFAVVIENTTNGRRAGPDNSQVMDTAQLREMVFKCAKGVPVYGMCTNHGPYQIISLAVPPPEPPAIGRGITVMLVGGDFDYQAEGISMGGLKWPGDTRKKMPEVKKALDDAFAQSMIDNRVKPGEELGKKFTFGPDQNVMILMGNGHNPEIARFTEGMKKSIPDTIPIVGGASMSGPIYLKDRVLPDAMLALRLSGKFQMALDGCGPYWFATDKRAENLKAAIDRVFQRVEKPDLLLGFMCASWTGDEPLTNHYATLKGALPAGVPFFGSLSGGEVGVVKGKPAMGGAFCMLLAIRGSD